RQSRRTLTMVRWVRGFLVAAALAVTAGLLARPAHATGDDDILVDDAGPGFEQAGDQAGQGGAVSRTFVHPAGQLILQYTPLGQDMNAEVFFSFMDQAPFQFSGLVHVDVPGLPLARWSATEGVPP